LPGIAETIKRVTRASRLDNVRVISNPNFGLETTAEDVVAGHEKLKNMLRGQFAVSCVCALEGLCSELKAQIDDYLIPIKIYIRYPWLEGTL
jgi:hypothetical protein